MRQTARPADGLVWVKDSTQIIVINVIDQTVHLLQGKQMAVWDWLALGYSFTKVARMLSELHKLPLKDAEMNLEKMIQDWVKNGMLVITEQQDG